MGITAAAATAPPPPPSLPPSMTEEEKIQTKSKQITEKEKKNPNRIRYVLDGTLCIYNSTSIYVRDSESKIIA